MSRVKTQALLTRIGIPGIRMSDSSSMGSYALESPSYHPHCDFATRRHGGPSPWRSSILAASMVWSGTTGRWTGISGRCEGSSVSRRTRERSFGSVDWNGGESFSYLPREVFLIPEPIQLRGHLTVR